MSADNGIYIGSFPTVDGGKEYRVIHAQAIDNCEDHSQFPQQLTDAYRVLYYGGSPVLDLDQAWARARTLYEQVMQESGVLEYGISTIDYDRHFPTLSQQEAQRIQDHYWGKRK